MGCIKIQSISIRSSRRLVVAIMQCPCSAHLLLFFVFALTPILLSIRAGRQAASHTDWLLLLLYRILLFHLSERVGEPQPGIIQSSPT